jgi:ubiquitin-like protein Pup
MPTRDSGEQQHRSRSESADQDHVEQAEVSAAPSADIDAILDDIDAALETTAEEFVRGFVQKGGE